MIVVSSNYKCIKIRDPGVFDFMKGGAEIQVTGWILKRLVRLVGWSYD
jgi:hypothetical protein